MSILTFNIALKAYRGCPMCSCAGLQWLKIILWYVAVYIIRFNKDVLKMISIFTLTIFKNIIIPLSINLVWNLTKTYFCLKWSHFSQPGSSDRYFRLSISPPITEVRNSDEKLSLEWNVTWRLCGCFSLSCLSLTSPLVFI